MRPVLLAARFVIEIALLVAVGVAAWALPSAVVARLLLAVVAVLAVAAVWGALLSPRRRVDAPLAVRVVVELALVVTAAAGLAAVGRPGAGLLLVVAEIVVLVGLAAIGLPPGSDVGSGIGAPGGGAARGADR